MPLGEKQVSQARCVKSSSKLKKSNIEDNCDTITGHPARQIEAGPALTPNAVTPDSKYTSLCAGPDWLTTSASHTSEYLVTSVRGVQII